MAILDLGSAWTRQRSHYLLQVSYFCIQLIDSIIILLLLLFREPVGQCDHDILSRDKRKISEQRGTFLLLYHIQLIRLLKHLFSLFPKPQINDKLCFSPNFTTLIRRKRDLETYLALNPQIA